MKKLKQLLIDLYTTLRHPKSLALKRKGIKWSQYTELNKKWILDSNINTVIDVGANVGEFAKILRELLPDSKIYSLEPLPDCFQKLKEILPGDRKFMPMNIAAGSKSEILKFYRSYHSPSSSFLQMEEIHKQAFPFTMDGQSNEAIDVQVDSLDRIFSDIKLEGNILLKIDVQGFESEVLSGASNILSQTNIIFIEMSFVGLYKDLPLFHDIYTKLYDNGFRYKGALAQMLHAGTGEVVQMDAIFVRHI